MPVVATNNFLIPNATLFVELIAFLIVLAVIGKLVLPQLNQQLDLRAEKIKGEMVAADEAKADATAAEEDRRRALEEARSHAREIVATANRTADQVSADAQDRAHSEYERILAAAEADVRLARQRALEQAATELGSLVVDVTERIIGREVNAEAHRDLIDEATAALAGDDGAATGAAGPGATGGGTDR